MSADTSGLPPGRTSKPEKPPERLDEAVIAGKLPRWRFQRTALQFTTHLSVLNVFAVFPPDTKILSITPSGASAWVQTVRIDARNGDGSVKPYFMKVGTLHAAIDMG